MRKCEVSIYYHEIGQKIGRKLSSNLNVIIWQHNILHIGICLQRIRLNRPFLHARIGESWIVCAKAAQDMFVPYRRMRENNVAGFLRSQRFTSLEYQVYTAAVSVAGFWLVERSLPRFSSQSMIQDVQMVISDLEQVDLRPMLADGVKVLRKMLDLFEQDHDKDSQTRTSLVKEIASVFGGEELAKKYLKRSDDDTLDFTKATRALQPLTIGEPDLGHTNTAVPSITNHPNIEGDDLFMAINDSTSFDFEVALDMLSFDQWLDYPIPDGTYPPLDQ